MAIKVVLVDLNTKMISAWQQHFAHDPNVTIVHGSILDQHVDAWVSPTNVQGDMSGGVDAAIRGRLGDAIQNKVKQEIARAHGKTMPVGYSTCVSTGRKQPAWLISTPTMTTASQPIRETLDVALACCAAFQSVVLHNEQHDSPISSLALPGLGAGTGRVPVEVCAELMWVAYDLFHREYFEDFESMRATLEAEMNAIDPTSSFGDAARNLRERMANRKPK